MNLLKVTKKFILILSLLLNTGTFVMQAVDYDFDATNDDEFDEIMHMPNLVTRSTNKGALEFLVNTLHLNDTLAKNFFRRTNSLNKRPVETLPIFWLMPDKCANLNWNFRTHLFFNDNGYLHMSPKGYTLGTSYIQLNEEFFEDIDIQEFQDKLPSLFLMSPAKIQERRLGFMFQTFKNWQKYSLEALFGLIYDERNYFFTPEEQAALTDQFAAENTSNGARNPTLIEHALSDKIGITDLQLKFRIPICDTTDTDRVYINAGPIVTVPTAFALKNGIFGSNFVGKSHRPTFNIKQLLDDAQAGNTTNAAQIVIPVLVNSIDRLSEDVLQTPLGNGGHFGVGALIEPQYIYSDSIRVPISAWFEYLVPAYEPRFYIQKKYPALFTDDALYWPGMSEAEAGASLAFLDEQAINTIYLERESVKVHPGFTGEFQIAPEFKINSCIFTIGYDFWFKQREHLGKFQTAQKATIAQLNRAYNKPFCAYQNKVFSKICYRAIKKTYDWTLDISGEKTLSSYGIGKGWSLAIAFEINY
jgi:hypothetical protein